MSKNIAVVLSGCGVFDGAEIHESTLTLLAIEKAGAKYQCFAPNIEQHHVINHITGSEMSEKRNVLIESARIARGNIKDLKDFNASGYDAIIFPGGFGVAKNLSSLAFHGSQLTVNSDMEAAVKSMAKAGKPIGALCIAPAVMAKILDGALVTIGTDKGTIEAIEALNGEHEEANHGEIIVDEHYKLVTTPCYMLDATISQVEEGVTNVVNEILQLIK